MSFNGKIRENRSLVLYLMAFAILLTSLWMLEPDLENPATRLGDSLNQIVEVLLIVCLILISTNLLLSSIKKVFTSSVEKYIESEMDTKLMWQLTTYLIWILTFIILVLIFTRDPTGLGVSIGIVSAALVFILQRPLLNIAGWIVIITKRPYTVGEHIEVQGRKGFVVEINLMYTQFREFGTLEGAENAFSGRFFTIPNAHVLEYDVVNYDQDTSYLWDELKVCVTYESDMALAGKHIQEAVEETVGKHMKLTRKFVESKIEFEILKKRHIYEPVIRQKMADSCVNFYAIYFVNLSLKGVTRSSITEKILEKFAASPTVSIAYPHLELVPHQGTEHWDTSRSPELFLRRNAAGLYSGGNTRMPGRQTRLDTLTDPRGKGPAPATDLQKKPEDCVEKKGTILLPLSRIRYRESLIRFMADLAGSLGYHLKVLDIVKTQPRNQRQIDMEAIARMEKAFSAIKKDFDNVSMDIKVYSNPVQSIVGAMSGKDIRMLVIPWNSKIIPNTSLYELLEKAGSLPAGKCDIAVIKDGNKLATVKRILVPVGHGKNIVKMGSLLRHLSRDLGLELVLLGVASRPEEKDSAQQRLKDFHENVLLEEVEGCENLKAIRITGKVVVNRNTADAILQAGKDCQLITLGATGHRDLKSYLFGSIADIVLRGATVPVLVLQKGKE